MLLVSTTQNNATCGTPHDGTEVYSRHMSFTVSMLFKLYVVMTRTVFESLDLK